MAENVFASTLDFVPNYTIIESKGIIEETGYSSSYYSDNLYTMKNKLQRRASSLGCNAIINIKHKFCTKGDCIYFYSYGEAVIIEKNPKFNEATLSQTPKPSK